ncbi:ubiquitin-related domain-containing protein [Blastocladiella britannica]|nr:ubiquitin-related domain-containing protein [Blastocladiella britannica]
MTEENKPDVAQVTIKVRDGGSSESVIEFRVKSSAKFSRIAKAYAQKRDMNLDNCRFVFDGETIKNTSEQTIAELGIEDGDFVDMNLGQIGGSHFE